MEKHSTVGPEPPGDYRILLPAGWYQIPLEQEGRDASIAALLKQQFKGVDNAPHIKDELRKDLTKRARKIQRNGGIEFYLSFQQAGPLTIPASLIISLVPPEPGRDLSSLAQHLSDNGPPGRKVDVVDLASANAVRSLTLDEAPNGATSDGDLPKISAEYFLTIPRTEALLLLSFSSPLGSIAEALIGLFDAISGSLTWEE